jgi:hypothetical protein
VYLEVVLVYDYLLTLDSEIKYIWVRQHKRGSAWYLFIRYFTLFSNIAMAFLVFENLEAEVRLHLTPKILINIR